MKERQVVERDLRALVSELAAELGVLQQQQQQQGQGPPPPPQCEENCISSRTDIGLCIAAARAAVAKVTTVTGAHCGAASIQPAANGQLPIGSGSACSGSAANKCRSHGGSTAGGIPRGKHLSGSNSGSNSGSFARRKYLVGSSVEVEAPTAGIQSPPVPQSAHRVPSPEDTHRPSSRTRGANTPQRLRAASPVRSARIQSPPVPRSAHRAPSPDDTHRPSSRMRGANPPQRVRAASPLRVQPAMCTPPVQMASPAATVRSSLQRTPKKLGDSIGSHTTSLHARKASPDHMYPVREYANKTSY